MFIVSAAGGKKQFWANFDFWVLLYRPPFTDEGQIWCARTDPRSTLTRQISSECVHCVGFRCQKHNFGQILTFWGSCTDPLLPMKAEFDVYSIPMVYAYVPNFVSIGLFCRTLLVTYPIFAVFWTSAFSGVANWQQSEKVEYGCTCLLYTSDAADE